MTGTVITGNHISNVTNGVWLSAATPTATVADNTNSGVGGTPIVVQRTSAPTVGIASNGERQRLLDRPRTTARCIRSATRATSARWAASHAQPADRRDGRLAVRQGLLAGRVRRRDLQLRRRRTSSARPAASTSTSRSSAWPPRQDGNGYWTGRRPTAGSSASATPHFFGSTGGIHLNQPIVGMAGDARPATATGWSHPTAGSSASATPTSSARWAASTSTSRSSAWPLRPPATATGLVASDGGIFSFGDAALLRLDRRHPPQPADRRHGRHARTATATGLVASDGGIFSFGDAHFFGSVVGQ